MNRLLRPWCWLTRHDWEPWWAGVAEKVTFLRSYTSWRCKRCGKKRLSAIPQYPMSNTIVSPRFDRLTR